MVVALYEWVNIRKYCFITKKVPAFYTPSSSARFIEGGKKTSGKLFEIRSYIYNRRAYYDFDMCTCCSHNYLFGRSTSKHLPGDKSSE